jgi:acyl transferase domain-containing protein
VTYTCHVGRRAFEHRRVVVCTDAADAVAALEGGDPRRVLSGRVGTSEPLVAFMFPGQGTQYAGMARGLYRDEPRFRAEVDRCSEALEPHLGCSLARLLTVGADGNGGAPAALTDTALAQPALFVVEWALARLLGDLGVRPQAMIGHSVGELVAACLAGVVTLDDALRLVAARGRLVQALPRGAMLGVPLAEADVVPLLDGGLSLAAVNTPTACSVAGPEAAVGALERALGERGVQSWRLVTSHAFHSAMIDPALAAFREHVAAVRLAPPRIPFLSNVTGTWITDAEATDPDYWVRHLRQTVRFADGIAELAKDPAWLFVEVGPGRALGTLARRHPALGAERSVLATLPAAKDARDDLETLLESVGRLWLAGVRLDGAALYAGEQRRRIALPTYPFERTRHWLEAGPMMVAAAEPEPTKHADAARWLYAPGWTPAEAPAAAADAPTRWLVLADEGGLADGICARLGGDVVRVRAGGGFLERDDGGFEIDPRRAADWVALLTALRAAARLPQRIVHCWAADGGDTALERGLLSLIPLAQALGTANVADAVDLAVVARGMQAVGAEESVDPDVAALLAACRTIPQEVASCACRTIDVSPLPAGDALLGALAAELRADTPEKTVALRGGRRWLERFEPVPAPAGDLPVRPGGVYLVTGGLGQIGLALAEHLARTVQAKLVLVGRSPLPPRDEWDAYCAEHGDDDPAARRLRRLAAIEALGGEVLALSADVGDAAQMAAVRDAALARFGAVHGLVHAAGASEIWAPLAETDAGTCVRHFHPKAGGARVVDEVFAGDALDFAILCSSLSTVLGGIGMTAYAAANAWLDAFAASRIRRLPWIAVNLDAWRFDAGSPASGLGRDVLSFAMTPDEGVRVLEAAARLAGARPRVVVSTGDLGRRLDRWVALRGLRAAGEAGAHPRPAIGTAYRAPADQTEEIIAKAFGHVLGVDGVGADDDFFELGGDSLLAVHLNATLREAFQVDVPMVRVFESPTVSGLAQTIAALCAENTDLEKLEETLRQVQGLSDDEVARLLEEPGLGVDG